MWNFHIFVSFPFNTSPLTPNHLLYGRMLTTSWCGKIVEVLDDENNIENRLKYIQDIVKQFWKTWNTEYLQELRRFRSCKNNDVNNKISINDVVLIEDSRLWRSEWRVGRVSELIKSNDGTFEQQ